MTVPDDIRSLVSAVVDAAAQWLDTSFPGRVAAVDRTLERDNTFTREAIDEAIRLSMSRLTLHGISDWLGVQSAMQTRRIAVLNAGNVPFVELQDFLAVVLTGHRYLGVLSRQSPFLLPAFGETIACDRDRASFRFVSLEEGLRDADALIATGSTATTRLLSQRFLEAGVPASRHLLRGTRTGAAVLRGDESSDELYALAKDVLLHEGRGCRNVSTILAPSGEDPSRFISAASRFRADFPAHPDTVRSVRRVERFMNAVKEPAHFGDGFVILENEVQIPEPSLVRWMVYDDALEVKEWLDRQRALLQVVVADDVGLSWIPDGVEASSFGQAQDPPLDWRPDGMDTVSFLRKNLVSGI